MIEWRIFEPAGRTDSDGMSKFYSFCSRFQILFCSLSHTLSRSVTLLSHSLSECFPVSLKAYRSSRPLIAKQLYNYFSLCLCLVRGQWKEIFKFYREAVTDNFKVTIKLGLLASGLNSNITLLKLSKMTFDCVIDTNDSWI